ncbi:MAG TPA: peptidylprolyl isomerase, partial [Candidatus Margulisiibacteriota bacterium]|nr:peptidylprolyl isomerase [Candidatus Margulisiibacteriota bacterium]
PTPQHASRARLLSLVLLGILASAPAPAATVNKILATVDGEPITLYQLKQYSDRNLRTRQGPPLDRTQMLDALITDKVIEKEASDKGIIVRDEDIDRYIEGIKERNHLNDEQLEQALTAQGLTKESYRLQVREDIQKAQLINREIRGKVNVTPEEVERYYKAHISEYSTPERIEVAHILFHLDPNPTPDQVVAMTAKAEEVRGRIQKGADFAEMAKQYSDDPSGKDGGNLGWFKHGEMLDEIEKVAEKLKVGEVSEPVRTKAGIHLIKLEGREGASHENLSDLQDQIKQQLYNAALEDRFEKWLTDELRKRHHVETLE